MSGRLLSPSGCPGAWQSTSAACAAGQLPSLHGRFYLDFVGSLVLWILLNGSQFLPSSKPHSVCGISRFLHWFPGYSLLQSLTSSHQLLPFVSAPPAGSASPFLQLEPRTMSPRPVPCLPSLRVYQPVSGAEQRSHYR